MFIDTFYHLQYSERKNSIILNFIIFAGEENKRKLMIPLFGDERDLFMEKGGGRGRGKGDQIQSIRKQEEEEM